MSAGPVRAIADLPAGGTVIVTGDPSPTNVFSTVDRHRATWTFMVPTIGIDDRHEEIDRST